MAGLDDIAMLDDAVEQGRAIVSSMQQKAQNRQWIAWQRCRGAKVHNSSFGVQGAGATGTSFSGMGEPGRYITASSGTAVMFVEVSYDFDAPTPLRLFDGTDISYNGWFNIYDSRDLAQLYSGGPVASCATYSGLPDLTAPRSEYGPANVAAYL
jgi:hypothetical protein